MPCDTPCTTVIASCGFTAPDCAEDANEAPACLRRRVEAAPNNNVVRSLPPG
ncbi:Uncharacterised protein [Mycobacteroides abscessus subsp. abscessus]|nr:Uncharacterised protein [Mycobacteroides abscessus subsp. abscessus]